MSSTLALQPLPAKVARILLVDDDEFIAISLGHYLRARGCRVETATAIADAKVLLRTRTYDLVLVDPYMTGEAERDASSFLRTIALLQPDAQLVIASAYVTPHLSSTAERFGAIAVLSKPQSVVFLSQLVMSATRTAIHPSSEEVSQK